MGIPTNEIIKISNSIELSDESKKIQVKQHLDTLMENIVKWEKITNAVEVKDFEDKAGMRLAKQTRLSIRAERLEATKHLDSLVAEIKDRMADDMNEKKVWETVKKLVESTSKTYEESLKFLEDTSKRYEESLILQVRLDRMEKLSIYVSEPQNYIKDDMSEADFDVLLTSLRVAYEATEKQKEIEAEEERKRIEAKIESEKVEKLLNSRKLLIAPMITFLGMEYPDDSVLAGDDEAFNAYCAELSTWYDKAQATKIEAVKWSAVKEARTKELEVLSFELDRLGVQFEMNIPNLAESEQDIYEQTVSDIRKIISDTATNAREAALKQQLDQQTIIQRKERIRAKMIEMDKYRMPNEEPIEYIIPNDEQILDNEVFDAYCKVLDDDIWKMKNGLADRIAEKSDKQRQALIDYDRFQIVQQLLLKLPLDDTLFEQITTVTIPGLLAKEEEAFVPVISTIPQTRIALTRWSEKVPVPFPSPSMPAQELLNTKFVEMLNEYVRKANVYLTSQDSING